VLVLLDFSKAFDCVHRLVSSFNFHGSARNMVSTFLNGRSMVVDADSARSYPLHHFFFYVCQLSVRTYPSLEISFLC
jgi:hypothetical protein